MTPLDIQELSQPLIDVYIGLENDLMMNIVKQLVKHNDITDTAKWQILKLSEVGALNKANLQTIANAIGGNKDLLEIILQEAALNSINEIEPALLEATRKGILEGATEPVKSTKVAKILKHFQNQAEDNLNLVNTVMQYKAKQKYSFMVNRVAELVNKQEFVNTLNKTTAETITGAISRQQALRQTIIEFNNKGIPAFVDKLGREWSPEGYLNMDIRTTTSNVAHEAQFARMEDYGSDLIEVSSHSGARPKCAKDQGKVYSRSGKTKGYPKFSTTSFGLPDGLLGINCGHMVYPYFEGISTQRFFPEKEEENNRKYKESQIQRALERDVRKSKRKAMLLNEAGDKEAFQKASVELKAKEQRLKQFTKDNKRPRRKDREQKFGYNKSVSQKAVQANKKIENEANKMYNIGNTQDNVKAYMRDKPLRDKIKSDATNKTIFDGDFNKHIVGTNEYKQYQVKQRKANKYGPSILTISKEESQRLIDKYAGTGILQRRKDGSWIGHEIITVNDMDIGICVNDMTGVEATTTVFKIKYNNKGTHLVPDYPSKKGVKATK